ncbi:ATP-binding protein [Mitsuokella multacida]|uniref:ATP-binding protein n=1 Tax=Mitsuokella multacida TaxID=52226 RepID=UPI003D06226E
MDVDYVPVARNSSQMLFRIADEQMTAAMIDRLAHHGHLLMASGRNYRIEHALMRQDAVVEPAS